MQIMGTLLSSFKHIHFAKAMTLLGLTDSNNANTIVR